VQLVPTHCRGCGAIGLSSRAGQAQVEGECSACGGVAVVVPGPSFGAHEQALFQQLTGVARRAQLRPAEAQRLCIDIEMGLARADQEGTLAQLAERLPELGQAAARLGDSSALQARALRMLETILNALTIPKKSLSMPVAPVPLKRNA
jgi:tRNA G26 N,N-dimethylase Trm1